ncbi:MAG: asparagine synthase (glutamine-hydrolyzing) [Bryobacterales bacterium]|nr:asparagine synthase (glutamine-hydrolyzing) [Bryobacterales bacterium]MBV9399514.1 asparagine synthase (glutamine-hydrolyzing) [Bryobacterales bacterium]
MCGILAIRNGPAVHHRQLASLRRRGPDAIGYWVNADINISHTRLSIIGLDERGSQPVENERHVIAFNGEIYNFEDIRAALGACKIRVQGSTDTEVLLHAWTKWGPQALPRLTGFWAFVVYDKQERTLTLVRDQLGIKPLYYWHSPEQTVVSSLLRTVVETASESPDLDYQALSEYVRYQFTFGEKTFFKQVKKVLPGQMVEIHLPTGALKTQCYEDILNPTDQPNEPLTPGAIQRTNELIISCCYKSTISDTSFTTFCSGGMDSSLITAITRPDVAYHCNYKDPECNETFFAKQVIEHIHANGGNTRLMTINADEDFDLCARVASIIEDFDEPAIGSVIFPLDDLLSRVKARYKVILTGTGGDELFAGYVRYQLALGECFQDSYRMLFEKMASVKSVAARFEMTHAKGNTDLYAFYDREAENTFREAYQACGSGSELQKMLMFDRRYFLSGLLNIDDKMCGRHSLESRPSLLHQDLVRHIVRIEPDALLTNKDLKYLLRFAALGYLPESVVRRTDKMGFTTPIGDFVNRNAHRIREQIMDSRFRQFYNLKTTGFHADNKYSREAFGLLMLDTWLNRYVRPQ